MFNRELIRQVFAFGCVGVTATLVHYLVAVFFTDIASISVFLSNVMGYCAAVSISIFGHSIFTYKKKINAIIARRFIVVSLATLLASEAILLSLTSLFDIHHRISLAVVVSTIPVVSFFINKFWVYSSGSPIA